MGDLQAIYIGREPDPSFAFRTLDLSLEERFVFRFVSHTIFQDLDKPNMADVKVTGRTGNLKCLGAIVLVSLCPFQYGIDFGVIGGQSQVLF